MGITGRNDPLGEVADTGIGRMKPGLSNRGTALLFAIIKARSLSKSWELISPFLEIGAGNLGHYASGERRLPHDSAEKVIEAAVKNKWMSTAEAKMFRSNISMAAELRPDVDREFKFSDDLVRKIIKAFEKKSPRYRFGTPPPDLVAEYVVSTIEDAIGRIQEAMDTAVWAMELPSEDHDPRSWEEREADAAAGEAAHMAELAQETVREETARRAYEDMLPKQLCRGSK